MTKKFAVVLAGCGVYDGAEVTESVTTLLAIDRAGASYQCFAPDIPQLHVINHLTGDPMEGETRNVLTEAARIPRGAIKPISEYAPSDFDAIIFPGGFGAAKNLCTFAIDGPDCKVDPSVQKAIIDTREAGKPIGALCISPALMAKVLGAVKVTIGSDADTAAGIEKMGATHQNTDHAEIVVDADAKLVTTPCYMLDASVSQIAQGAENVVNKLIELA